MKALFLSIGLILGTFSEQTFAAAVDGKIMYKVSSSNELVERSVTLEVPARGQGEVVLSGPNFEWRTSTFKTVKIAGQTTFIALFKVEFMNKKSTILFKGTYLRGTNRVSYSGDFYKRKGYFNQMGNISGFMHEGVFHFDQAL